MTPASGHAALSPTDPTSAAPVIDLSDRFTLPAAVSEAIVADRHRKPRLKDYLGNLGQKRARPRRIRG